MDKHGDFPIEEGLIARDLVFNRPLRRLRIDYCKTLSKPRLVAYLIVRNEEANMPRALDALSRYADSVIVLDNGSTDATVDICKSYPVVELVEYHPEPWHEGNLRNRALTLCRSVGAEWILSLDADEVLEEIIVEEINSLLMPLDPWIDTYAFYLLNFWEGEEYFRVDERWKPTLRIRLFRDRPHYFCGNAPTHVGPNPVNLHWKRVRISSIRLRHWGYCDVDKARAKYDFYTSKNPERDFSWLIDQSNVRLEKYVPGEGSYSIGRLEPPLSARFLRECFLAGRWLRRCHLESAENVMESFVKNCPYAAASRCLRAGYMLGVF